MMQPAYLQRTDEEFAARIVAAQALQSPCRLCPRQCRVNRAAGETGFCRATTTVRTASCGPHFGEERPLVGRGGSGTIFFSYCTLGCIFCQNADISHGAAGRDETTANLAAMMLSLQDLGCHNINLVTPSHYMPQILTALNTAIRMGLSLPIVYNCSGYESVEALQVLDGIVDIYMPDAKFADGKTARRLCAAPDYPARLYEALREMHRQVGDLAVGPDGIARRGLLVRHLVLPEGLAGTAAIADFLAALSPQTYVNIMDQYRPCHEAGKVAELSRRITREEYREAVQAARVAGLSRFDR